MYEPVPPVAFTFSWELPPKTIEEGVAVAVAESVGITATVALEETVCDPLVTKTV